MQTHPYFFDSLVSPEYPTLFFVTAFSCLSPFRWHHFCPEMSRVHRILHNIFYMYVFSHFWIYLIFVIFGYVSIGLIVVSYISCFPFLLLYLLTKCSLNYTHEMHQLFIVTYFVNAFHCTNFIILHQIFQVIQLTFSFFHDNVDRYTFTWQCKAMIAEFNVYAWVYTDIYKGC